MVNIKLAFERYLDFLRIQRRESMIKWCLEVPNCVNSSSISSHSPYSEFEVNQIWKQGILTTSVLRNYILHPQLRNVSSFKKHWRLIKRDFTSTTTKFFDNNFDIIVDDEMNSGEIVEEANKKYNDICKELKFFNNESPETFTPDIIVEVSKLFDWLYSNKQYEIAYKLLHKISPNYNIFFKFNQYSKMIEVFDKYGDTEDLFLFCEVFKYEKIPNIWRKVNRLINDKYVNQLIKLSDVKLFSEAKPLLDNMLEEGTPRGLKYFAFRGSSLLYKNFDSDSRIRLYDYLINLDNSLKMFFPPSLISQLFSTYESNHINELDLQYTFLEQFMKMHYNPEDINEESYQYKLISALPKDCSPILKFKLWFNYCYNNEKLSYDRDIRPIVYLKNNRMQYLPKHFEKSLAIDDKTQLDTIFSILIYTYSKYDGNTKLGQIFYRLKKKLELPINHSDKIGYLKSLAGTKNYSKALSFLQKCLEENPDFESDETLNPILIVLAKNKSWNKLENIYTERYENNEVVSKDQYITLFIALSSRPGTNKVMMELWENYLKRGFEPNDQILSSIILCFINNKSYEEGLQWFTAYSHYNVELTYKSYGLMLHALAGLKNIESVFKVLDELVKNAARVPRHIFPPIFMQLSTIGDYKSIETILSTYYPIFNIPVEREDSRWIMKCHYHANRFSMIVHNYLSMNENEILYKDSLLALESAVKYRDMKTFEEVWEKVFGIHYVRGDLDIKAYIFYMSYWVRKYGAFGIEIKLNEIKNNIKGFKEFPTILFNQMIFSSLRTHRPWLTKKIVRIALLNNVVPSPKTYSLILQSNVSMPWVARNSIDETAEILEEFLMNRKEDKFGKLHDDLNPMSLKLVIKAIIKYKDVYEARRLFDLYVESSRDNLLDNLHILNIELMLLGEEERWVDFDGCYDRYLTLLYKLNEQSRLRDNELNDRFNNDDFDRLDIQNDIYLRDKYYDEYKIKNLEDVNIKIPNWIKKAHSDIWIYRLKQLEVVERLDEVNSIISDLISKGIIFDNKNLNETALFLSQRPELLEEAAFFIDKYLLPYHIKNRNFKMMKIRYATEEIPGIKKDNKVHYKINRDIYFEVMKNLSDNINEKLTPNQRDSLLASIANSPNKYFLKNLEQVMKERRHIRSSYLQTKKLRTTFYRDIRSRMKVVNKKIKKNMSMWRVDKEINYRNKMNELRKQMDHVIWKIHQIMGSDDSNDLHGRRILGNSSEVLELMKEKKVIRSHMNALRKEKDEKLREIVEENNRKGQLKSYKVGRIDLNKL